MKNRSPLQLALLSMKGMAMGAADIVPGVSGGTIAFISGIYEELIDSINNINFNALKILKKEGLKSFWQHINGTFFVFLLAGIGISLLSLVRLVTYLLEYHPVLIWSFFFGLIIASIWMVGKTIKKVTPGVVVFLLSGTAIAFWISSIQTVASVGDEWYIFVSGAIAICAMILPGISGSFILVLMGSYNVVLSALKDVNLTRIALFGIGCIVGLLSFSRLLKFLFNHYKDITIALLTGFMIGSLYKVWPWKINIGDKPLVIHGNGKEDWMTQNVLPVDFKGDPQIMMAVVCLIVGFSLIMLLERFGPKEK